MQDLFRKLRCYGEETNLGSEDDKSERAQGWRRIKDAINDKKFHLIIIDCKGLEEPSLGLNLGNILSSLQEIRENGRGIMNGQLVASATDVVPFWGEVEQKLESFDTYYDRMMSGKMDASVSWLNGNWAGSPGTWVHPSGPLRDLYGKDSQLFTKAAFYFSESVHELMHAWNLFNFGGKKDKTWTRSAEKFAQDMEDQLVPGALQEK